MIAQKLLKMKEVDYYLSSILSKSGWKFFMWNGAKSENININHPLNIISLRGPLTYELLKDLICQI